MLTLLSECRLWTTRDEIRIKNTDFGAYKYATKRDFDSKSLAAVGKKEYCERRSGITLLTNRKPCRLKDNIRKLEELLKVHKIVHTEWKESSVVQILLSNGILVHIRVDVLTGDVQKMAFDKYFVGKLAADVISDAVFTRQHVILAYNTNQVTVVYLQKPNMRKYGPEKLANMDPKIFHVLIPGPSERKLHRHLAVNSSFDLVIIWTKSSQNEVYPWRPTIRDQDRANLHVYKLRSAKLESVAYCWTENDPICVKFLRASEGQIFSVEQKVSRKGEITAEICSYEINNMKLQRTAVTSIQIGTQICCHGLSPDQEKLILGTIDRYVCLYDLTKKITRFAPKTDIIPTQCAWHPDSGIVMIANDRSQFQCFDISLCFVGNQLISEDVTPSNLLDLSHYFSIQPTLLNVCFSNKPDLSSFAGSCAQTECFLLLSFENGPLGCLRFFSGSGMAGDVHNSGLTPDVLVNKYLVINQLEKAVNLLLTLNWNTYGAICLISLHKIANYILTRNDVKRSRNDLFIRALNSFTEDLVDETKDEFADQVIDIKRRLFFFLIRNKLYQEAFEAARDIGDYDLFMDIFNVTKSDVRLHDFSREAFTQAEHIISQGPESTTGDHHSGVGDTLSTCSHSSCSEYVSQSKHHMGNRNTNNSAMETSQIPSAASQHLTIKRFQKNHSHNEHGGGKFKNYVPPLPYFKSPVFNAENIKINIPKPELKVENLGNGFRPIKARNTPVSDYRHHIDEPIYVDNHALGGHFVNNFRIPHPTPGVPHHAPNGGYHVTSVIPHAQNQSPEHHIGPWSKVPDQTLGIPIATHIKTSSVLSSSLSHLPRSSASPGFSYPLSYNQKLLLHELTPNNNSNFPATDSLCNIPKFYQHPLVSGNIPSSNVPLVVDDAVQRLKRPAASILSNSSSNANNSQSGHSIGSGATSTPGKKDSGEKNKVKFSDTVQVAVVPEIPRKEKPQPSKRNGFRPLLTNPQRELADSLPLCHPHDEYLKDFNPITDASNHSSKEESGETASSKNPPTIKVVHFGVV